MQTFGNYLKEQREAKNISLKEVAYSTNVTERYLDFIEKDDFERVPEGPYIRGYISLYATAIGISAHDALHRFDTQCRERNKAEDIQHEISEQKIRQRSIMLSLNKKKWILLFSAIVGLLIFVAFHLLFEDQNKSGLFANIKDADSNALQTRYIVKSESSGNVIFRSLGSKPETRHGTVAFSAGCRPDPESFLPVFEPLLADVIPADSIIPSGFGYGGHARRPANWLAHA